MNFKEYCDDRYVFLDIEFWFVITMMFISIPCIGLLLIGDIFSF